MASPSSSFSSSQPFHLAPLTRIAPPPRPTAARPSLETTTTATTTSTADEQEEEYYQQQHQQHQQQARNRMPRRHQHRRRCVHFPRSNTLLAFSSVLIPLHVLACLLAALVLYTVAWAYDKHSICEGRIRFWRPCAKLFWITVPAAAGTLLGEIALQCQNLTRLLRPVPAAALEAAGATGMAIGASVALALLLNLGAAARTDPSAASFPPSVVQPVLALFGIFTILTIVTELITVIKLVCLVRQERAQQRGRQQHGINV